MKTPTLAPVYLDNEPVSLMGDPRPSAGKIMAATGRPSDTHSICRADPDGARMGDDLDHATVIDRTEEPTKALYFISSHL